MELDDYCNIYIHVLVAIKLSEEKPSVYLMKSNTLFPRKKKPKKLCKYNHYNSIPEELRKRSIQNSLNALCVKMTFKVCW